MVRTVTVKNTKRDSLAKDISLLWTKWNDQRRGKIEEWKELRNYVFATDTTTTSNSVLPWKNKTTLPKLCQIRDNLHSNYLSAIFPNDDWLKWEAYDQDAASRNKVRNIEAYMENKTRIGGFRTEISKLIYDYIDYGNAFCTCDFIRSYRNYGGEEGKQVIEFVGPKVRRISPYDIVFNPLAVSFEESPKIVRSLTSLGDIAARFENNPDNVYFKSILNNRKEYQKKGSGASREDLDKADGYSMDGFGTYSEYLDSGFVELLDFYGDIYNEDKGEYLKGYHICVADRSTVILSENLSTLGGYAPVYHVGWRIRPDNLWAAGPLDNLVGMQYRIDHLQNLQADAQDLAVLPPLVIKGEVEDFEYGPGCEIQIDTEGSVEELSRNAQWVIQANNDTMSLENRMEQYAGAPREAMGIRSPGEKTMFEVQQLQNAAGRIFQEKCTHFEIELLEKVLNAMLETSIRNMDGVETLSVRDKDLGTNIFQEITKEDIIASGKLRPVGARHFAAQAQLMQNLQGIFNTPGLSQLIAPHISGIAMAELVEDLLGLKRYALIKKNIAVFEQAETQQAVSGAQEENEFNAVTQMEEGF